MTTALTTRAQSLIGLVLLTAVLGIASPHFLGADNLVNVLEQSSINAILGVGLTFVIISGGIDLSVGSVMALSGVVVADLLVGGVPVPVAAAAGVALGAGCGVLNGLITTVGRIPSFISTLGMMLVARSAAKIYTSSSPISGLPAPFRALSGTVLGIPVPVLVVVLLVAAAHQVLTRTRLGRYTYAIGGNEQAAWLSGVPTARFKIYLFALSGALAGVAAILMTSRLNAASPLAGEMYELYAIAAAVIGGVSLMGGEGRVVGTLIGALIMGTLRNGLNQLNVPGAWEGVVVGTVLVAAVIIDRARHHAPAGADRARVQRRRRIAMVALAALLLAGAGVYRWRSEAAAAGATATIAFVPKSIDSSFWVEMQHAAEKEAARHGARVITLAPDRETDVEAQFRIVENLIEQGVDAILLAPAGSKEMLSAIVKANRAGVPVLVVDSDIDRAAAARVGATTATFIGSDNYRGGQLAGEYLARALPAGGKVAIIEGTAGHESTDQRQRGFRDALAAARGLEVVAAQTANGERARAYAVMQNILQAHPDLAVVFGANDEMALGAAEALDAAGKLSSVRVIGFDASAEALESIRAGRMLGSVAQYPTEMGRIGVASAMVLIGGGRIEPLIHTEVKLIDKAAAEALP